MKFGQEFRLPPSNLRRWLKNEEALRQKYLKKGNRRKKSFGAGRTPLFPKSEQIVGDEIRQARQDQKFYSKKRAVARLKQEANIEVPEHRSVFTTRMIKGTIHYNEN